MLRTIGFFCLITSGFASETLTALVNASAGFSAAILQQLATVQGDPTPTKFAEKTISYAKTSYFTALRDAVPQLEDIATGQEACSDIAVVIAYTVDLGPGCQSLIKRECDWSRFTCDFYLHGICLRMCHNGNERRENNHFLDHDLRTDGVLESASRPSAICSIKGRIASLSSQPAGMPWTP